MLKKPGAVSKAREAGHASAKGRPEDRRAQPRFTTQFRSTFSGQRQEGQGRTLDISSGGCRVESDMNVAEGAKFECRLHVPGLDWPLRIEEATVRWVADQTFGLGFTRITPEEFSKLKKVLTDLECESAPS